MSRRSWRRLVAAAIFLLAGCGLLDGDGDGDGAGGAAAAPCPEAPSGRMPLPGFGEIAIRLESGDGTVTDACALLADDESARAQGLMGQRDLRGYDAMLFRWPTPSTNRFYMRDTIIPLTVAFFAADGRFVSAADMTPCPSEAPDCPRYGAAAPYQFAIEVPMGRLEDLGGGPGSTLTFPTSGH